MEEIKDGLKGTLEVLCPEKLVAADRVFSHIHPGDRIFIGSGCGEPQYAVQALIDYVKSHPTAFFDAEILHVWTLGVAPYTDEKFRDNFRHNSFFIGNNTRAAVNSGLADYTPVFLSQVPELFRRKVIRIDVALVQVSPPDIDGNMSLGVSVNIVKAAVETASLVIAQVNRYMPRVSGDSVLNIEDVDFMLLKDEPLLEYEEVVPDDIASEIGKYVARIVEDGDTIQVGYGSIPNAILSNLKNKRDIGVHTELLSDGIVELMKRGVVTNSRKSMDQGKTVASFCMGRKETYEYIHNNPKIEFRGIDYTNNPGTISQIQNITAINSALEIDLTGQATAESIGRTFYSGIGGQADFMRGAALAPGGKTILVLQSTAQDGCISRIVPLLKEGAGVTLTRGDIHYVVTEHGIAYLHGKNIRERAMALIAIAHPSFQLYLIEEARKLSLIYKDQAYISGEGGEYPRELETYRTTRTGMKVLLRPVKISDEPLLKDFFYSLSKVTVYKRFITQLRRMSHEKLQKSFVVVDYTKAMIIFAVLEKDGREIIAGVAQYHIGRYSHTAEVAVVVRDEYQNQGIGTELLSYLTYIARRQGLLGFTAEMLKDNQIMLRLFTKTGFDIEKESAMNLYNLRLKFRETKI